MTNSSARSNSARQVITHLQSQMWPAISIVLCLSFLISGCAAQTVFEENSASSSSSPAVTNTPAKADIVGQLESQYVIGPAAAREINYRIDWQHRDEGSVIKLLAVQQDSVYKLDHRNYLTRIRIEDGHALWRLQIANTIDEISGITMIDDRVYVTSGNALLVLDAANGIQIDKQPFDKVPNTKPVIYNKFLIYGSVGGQAVWHSYSVGYEWRSYQVAHTIVVPPVLHDGYVVVAGKDGSIMVLQASSATQYWNRKLLDSIVAAPAASNDVVYVAGLDQHLRAYDIQTGRTMWKALMESPLYDSPIVINDRVYQHVPGTGLVCYEAQPLDSPGGKLIWSSPNVAGNVVASSRNELFVWNGTNRTLHLVESNRGGVVKSIQLPQVAKFVTSGNEKKDVYVAGDDGRVERLVPRY